MQEMKKARKIREEGMPEAPSVRTSSDLDNRIENSQLPADEEFLSRNRECV